MNLFTKQKQSQRCRKQTYGYQRGKGGGGINWETGIDIYTLLYIKQITTNDLLYSTGKKKERHEASIKDDQEPRQLQQNYHFVLSESKVATVSPRWSTFRFPFCLVGNLVQLCRIKTFKSKMGP